jgi:hypothetical protein
METPERKIPNYIFEDLLFRRRLEKTLSAEQERVNALLAEHVRLLQERRALMAEVHEAVQQRWAIEEQSLFSGSGKRTEEEQRDE